MKNRGNTRRIMRKAAGLGCAIVVAITSLSACKKDGDDGGKITDCRRINEVTQKMTNAHSAFNADPENKDKCRAFQEAAIEWMELVDKCGMVGGDQEEFMEEVRNSTFCD